MKLLIVGLGAIGQRHVRNLRALLRDSVELLAARSRGLSHVLSDATTVEAREGLCEKYGIRAFATLDDALAHKPDVAFVCNPTSLHIGTALALARAGCHLFIEKPLAHEYAGVEELLGIVERQGLVATVGYQFRFHPCLTTTYALLRSGAIGRVLAVRAEVGEYLPGWHTYEDYRGTYGGSRDLGGGTLLSQIHEMDYLYWFFGLPQRVFTLGGHLSRLDIDVEDVTSTLMQFERDGIQFPVHLHQDYVQRPASCCATRSSCMTPQVGWRSRMIFATFNAARCSSRRPGAFWLVSRAMKHLRSPCATEPKACGWHWLPKSPSRRASSSV